MRKFTQFWLPVVGFSLLTLGFSVAGDVFAQDVALPPAPLPGLDNVIDNSAAPAPVAAPVPVPVPIQEVPVVDATIPAPAPMPLPAAQPVVPQAIPAPMPAPAITPMPQVVAPQAAPVPMPQPAIQQPIQAPVQQPMNVAPQPAPQAPVYNQCPPQTTSYGPGLTWFLPPLKVYRAGEFNGPAYNRGFAPRRGASLEAGPYYTTRGPRDFYLQNPRPLGP